MSAGQGGHITFRNGVLEAVHLMVEQSRGVSAARLRESMSGIAQLCHIGLLGEFAAMPTACKMQCIYMPMSVEIIGI